MYVIIIGGKRIVERTSWELAVLSFKGAVFYFPKDVLYLKKTASAQLRLERARYKQCPMYCVIAQFCSLNFSLPPFYLPSPSPPPLYPPSFSQQQQRTWLEPLKKLLSKSFLLRSSKQILRKKMASFQFVVLIIFCLPLWKNILDCLFEIWCVKNTHVTVFKANF